MKFWLVAYPDGKEPRVVRASTKEGAIMARYRDDDDPIRYGIVAAWQLGNFPQQFQVVEDLREPSGVSLRDLGSPSVSK